jgi:hypothetical protein
MNAQYNPRGARQRQLGKAWCRRGESNPRPRDYETLALPLSYAGMVILNATKSRTKVSRRVLTAPSSKACVANHSGTNNKQLGHIFSGAAFLLEGSRHFGENRTQYKEEGTQAALSTIFFSTTVLLLSQVPVSTLLTIEHGPASVLWAKIHRKRRRWRCVSIRYNLGIRAT